MRCKWGEPDDELPIGRVIPPLPRYGGQTRTWTDSDEGNKSLLLGNDDIVEIVNHHLWL